MTITVSVLVSGGIVLAADSRQVAKSANGQMRVDSDNADKIFQLDTRLAVSVHGQGFFYPSGNESPRNIGMIVHSAAKHLQEGYTVAKAADLIHRKVSEEVERHCDVTGIRQAGVAFHLAGYNLDSNIGELYRCDVPGEVSLERKTNDAGAVWSGQRDIISRLILGYDPRLLEILAFWDDERELELEFRQRLRKLQLHIGFQTMPLATSYWFSNHAPA
jgi:20S proteasome alpha/beta subunit